MKIPGDEGAKALANKPILLADLKAALLLYKPINNFANIYDNIAEWEQDCRCLGLFKEDEYLVSSNMWPIEISELFNKRA